MKFFAFAIVLALVAAAVAETNGAFKLTPEQEQQTETARSACIEEIGANKEDVLALHNGDFSKVDEKLKCYSKCFQHKMGFVENGIPNEENIQKALGPIIGEDQAKSIQAKCNVVKGTDDCDTSLALYKCYFIEKAALLKTETSSCIAT